MRERTKRRRLSSGRADRYSTITAQPQRGGRHLSSGRHFLAYGPGRRLRPVIERITGVGRMRGRRSGSSGAAVVWTFRATPALLERLASAASRSGQTRGSIVRAALERELVRLERAGTPVRGAAHGKNTR